MLLGSPDLHLLYNMLFPAILCSQQVKEKKKQLKKDGKLLDMEEDDPEVVSQSHKYRPWGVFQIKFKSYLNLITLEGNLRIKANILKSEVKCKKTNKKHTHTQSR